MILTQQVDRTEARQGEAPGVDRYILGASITLAIVSLAGLYARLV